MKGAAAVAVVAAGSTTRKKKRKCTIKNLLFPGLLLLFSTVIVVRVVCGWLLPPASSSSPLSLSLLLGSTVFQTTTTAARRRQSVRRKSSAVARYYDGDDDDDDGRTGDDETAGIAALSFGRSPSADVARIANLWGDDPRRYPIPLQVMEQYVRQHSASALEKDTLDQFKNRTFAIGFYSCPLQAGNRLHHFFNGVLWSVVTNRTLLWKYWDEETCTKYDGRYYSPKICESANREEDCNQILTRAEWIPSFDDWSGRIKRAFGDARDAADLAYELPYFATHHPNASLFNSRFPWGSGDGNDERAFGVDNRTRYPHKVAIFPQERFKDAILEVPAVREALLHTESARRTATALYSDGPDFLYGMIHRYCFDFSPSILSASVPATTTPTTTVAGKNDASKSVPPAYTIALHSRHRYPELDGCNIERETKCLRQILDLREERTPQPCRISVMSDRECTVLRLKTWVEKHGNGCAVDVASHQSGGSFLEEHGPWAGAGYFADLALVSKSRSAFIGMERSSSDLLLELLEYNRVTSTLKEGGPRHLDRLKNLETCFLPFEGPGKTKVQ